MADQGSAEVLAAEEQPEVPEVVVVPAVLQVPEVKEPQAEQAVPAGVLRVVLLEGKERPALLPPDGFLDSL